ncbi:MAG: type II methionyl aminopeptidase [Nanoarchaeota archaeon]|nr:type II methionyl aminopeptidase [Nanoarchaeota archaeon]
MNETEKKDWLKAGRITAQAREYGKALIKPGALMLDVVEKIEDKIHKLGAKPAFPVQVSINEIAAHYTPQEQEQSEFRQGDLAKLDVGAHVNGAIGDTALTVNLGTENKELVRASEQALQEAIKLIRAGIEICEIGKVIGSTITSLGFNPIKNLTGHGLGLYEQHAGIQIPNYNNKDNTKLKIGDIIAVEPFATNGTGYIQDGKLSGIYKLENIKTIRDNYSREILPYIIKEYKTLPFAKRWLIKKFGPVKASFALRMLKQQDIIAEYNQLPESNRGLVSQSEHTILIENKPIVTTKE